jgi:chemotaxis protein MotB
MMASNRVLTPFKRLAALSLLAALVLLAGCSCKEYEEQIMQLDAQIADLQRQISEKEATNAECEQIANDLREALKEAKAENEVLVEQSEEVVFVTIPDQIGFASGQAMVLETMVPTLEAIASAIRQHPDWEIFVAGFTDDRKILEEYQFQYPTNWELGAHRSAAVVRYLTNQLDMPAERFAVVSYGPFHPFASNDTPEGRADNRVVKIVLHKPIDFP